MYYGLTLTTITIVWSIIVIQIVINGYYSFNKVMVTYPNVLIVPIHHNEKLKKKHEKNIFTKGCDCLTF